MQLCVCVTVFEESVEIYLKKRNSKELAMGVEKEKSVTLLSVRLSTTVFTLTKNVQQLRCDNSFFFCCSSRPRLNDALLVASSTDNQVLSGLLVELVVVLANDHLAVGNHFHHPQHN